VVGVVELLVVVHPEQAGLAAVETLEPLLLQQDLAERLTQAEVAVAQVLMREH
jgi:hypothetical protein